MQRPHLERTGFTMAPGAQYSGYYSEMNTPAATRLAAPDHDDHAAERLAGFTQWRDQDMAAGGTGRMTRRNLEWIDTAGASGTSPFSRTQDNTAGLGGMIHDVRYDSSGNPGGETYNAIRGMLGHGTEPGASTWGQQQATESSDERYDRVLKAADEIIGKTPGEDDWRRAAEEGGTGSETNWGDTREGGWDPEGTAGDTGLSSFTEDKRQNWRSKWKQFLTEEASEEDWKDFGVNTTSAMPAGGDETGKIEHVPDVGKGAAAVSADSPVEGDDTTELTERQKAFFRSNGLI